MRRFFALAGGVLALVMSSGAFAGTLYYSGALTTSSPTFVNPGGSTVGTARQYYSVQTFTVDTTGTYTIETASPNTAGTPSNALDTYLRLYAGAFNPATPSSPAALASNDDFTGALTVLPGPYTANGVTSTATGFTGAQPSSRISASLTTGTTYFLVNTSFRSTDYVVTATEGGPLGPFYTGIGGPGNISVPEPATLGAIALGVVALVRRRRA